MTYVQVMVCVGMHTQLFSSQTAMSRNCHFPHQDEMKGPGERDWKRGQGL